MATYCAYEMQWTRGGVVACCAEAEPGTDYCPVHRGGVQALPPADAAPAPRGRRRALELLPWPTPAPRGKA